MPSLWTRVRGALDPLARLVGLYTAYKVSDAEYIGSTNRFNGLHGARLYLEIRENEYEPQYLSAAKRHPGTNQLHDLSYRRIPSKHPPEAIDTEIGNRYRPGQCQFHVHVFAVGDRLQWFSHYETRPSAGLEHYRPSIGETYLRGVTDLDI